MNLPELHDRSSHTSRHCAPHYFIVGTDTEIGKTHVACTLLHALRQHGLTAIGMKPIAAGCDADGRNEDVEALRAASSQQLPQALVNPWCFADPIAPHLAAAAAGVTISADPVWSAYRQLAGRADVVIVEGVGGLLVPLAPDFDAADLACALQLPLILVVGMRLGCINHARLSLEALSRRGLRLAGWVANRIDPEMSAFAANLAWLENEFKQCANAPLLGVTPHGVPPAAAASGLNLAALGFATNPA